jgi:endonuclease YncB( thermonuclease family)
MNLIRVVALPLAMTLPAQALALTAEFPICGSGKRITCVVDGDTVWFEGVNYRFEEIDTPEKGTAPSAWKKACRQSKRRSAWAEILSTQEFTIKRRGRTATGACGAVSDREHDRRRDAD